MNVTRRPLVVFIIRLFAFDPRGLARRSNRPSIPVRSHRAPARAAKRDYRMAVDPNTGVSTTKLVRPDPQLLDTG